VLSSGMRDFRQKEKKKLPQNKPSRDESSLPRCNISSMAGSAAHGCFVNCHGLRRKNNKKHVHHYHAQKVRIALLMNCVKAAMFLGSAGPTIDEVLHRGRLDSSRLGLFWGTFFFSFWWKSLIRALVSVVQGWWIIHLGAVLSGTVLRISCALRTEGEKSRLPPEL